MWSWCNVLFHLWSSMIFLLFSLHSCIIIGIFFTTLVVLCSDNPIFIDINLYLILLHDSHLKSSAPSLLCSFHYTHDWLLFIFLNIIVLFCVLIVHLRWHRPPPTYPTNGMRHDLFIITQLDDTQVMIVVGVQVVMDRFSSMSTGQPIFVLCVCLCFDAKLSF